jgi:hypothetical protein
VAEPGGEDKRRITLELSLTRLDQIDALKKEWGIRGRGDVLERLLEEIFGSEEQEAADRANDADGSAAFLDLESRAPQGGSPRGGDPEGLDEQAALVLIGRGELDHLEAEFQFDPDLPAPTTPNRSGGGIDLPGFVRRRSDQIRRSIRSPAARPTELPLAALPRLSGDEVDEAMEAATQHWAALYGKPASETVLEAAMVWLGQDIWPQSDLSEGRTFTWSAACRVLAELVPGWGAAPPSFEQVIVTAGLLEDPFSGATLAVRIPTLIRRFVHRFRRRAKGTSFQTLEHTMTLQGALRLLQLPTDPGHRVTLAQIREAYRELALNHHPDSGGSVEAMRRLNEAYQLLKELYRQGSGGGPSR